MKREGLKIVKLMNFINDSKLFKLKIGLRRKLVIFFTIFVLMAIMIGSYIAFAHRNLTGFIENVLYENQKIEDVNENLLLYRYHLTEYLNSGDANDYQQFLSYKENLESFIDKEFNTITELNFIISNLVASGEELVELNQSGNDYQAEYSQFSNQIEITRDYLISQVNQNNRHGNEIYLDLNNLVDEVEIYSITFAGIIIIFSLIFLILFSKQITGPLEQIAKHSTKVASGNFDLPPIKADTGDEIEDIAIAFNTMTTNIKRLFNQLKEKLTLEKKLKEAELNKLQAQINPHFLYNTLNSISQVAILEDADETGNLITRVADLFRYNLKHSSQTVRLEKELNNLRLYFEIMEIRFGDNIKFNVEVSDDLKDKRLPSLTIQPLVENSFIHGLKGIDREGEININITEIDVGLLIVVEDNGRGIDKETLEEIKSGQAEKMSGLQNIWDRLSLYYGREDLFSIESRPEQGTKVELLIPEKESVNNEL